MHAILEGWQMADLLRAAQRAKREGDPRRFVRVAQRSLDPELVRAIEHQSGIAIAEHLEEVFRAWDGQGPDSLSRALCARVHALGLPLVIQPMEKDDGDDDDDGDGGGDGWGDTGEHPHVKRLHGRGTAMLVAGVVLSCTAAMAFVLSIALALLVGRSAGLVGFFAISLPLGLLGGALLLGGAARRRRARRLRDLEGLALSHVRLSLEHVGRELETSPAQTRALVLEALGHGIIEGRLDLGKTVFLSAIADTRFRERSAHCRACGASSAVVRGRGIVPRCPYCGALM